MSFASGLQVELAATPITVAAWMARCNAQYYATRDPFGVSGDFVTAPEISQLFGELIGIWLLDQWHRNGAPERSVLIELGPGRGTMMDDIRRVAAAAGWHPEVMLIESSPVLGAAQLRSHNDALRSASVADLPLHAAFVVANEFFDALPVRQFVQTLDGWHERVVGWRDGGFGAGLDPRGAGAVIPPALADAPPGAVIELSPGSTAIAAEIGARLRDHGGAALIVDYGYAGPQVGDTLQAVRAHAYADPFADPGEVDLTCHVDLAALAVAAGITAWGPVGQGDFLRAMHIDVRAAMLKRRATPDQAAAIDAAVERLTKEDAMGTLFKVMALTTGGPAPAGFA